VNVLKRQKMKSERDKMKSVRPVPPSHTVTKLRAIMK
jgi:hypothetical protein